MATFRTEALHELASRNAEEVRTLRTQHANSLENFSRAATLRAMPNVPNVPPVMFLKRARDHIVARRSPSCAIGSLKINKRFKVVAGDSFADSTSTLHLQRMMKGEKHKMYHMQPYATKLQSRLLYQLGPPDEPVPPPIAGDMEPTTSDIEPISHPSPDKAAEQKRCGNEKEVMNANLTDTQPPHILSENINSTQTMWRRPEDAILSSVGLKARGEWRRRWGATYIRDASQVAPPRPSIHTTIAPTPPLMRRFSRLPGRYVGLDSTKNVATVLGGLRESRLPGDMLNASTQTQEEILSSVSPLPKTKEAIENIDDVCIDSREQRRSVSKTLSIQSGLQYHSKPREKTTQKQVGRTTSTLCQKPVKTPETKRRRGRNEMTYSPARAQNKLSIDPTIGMCSPSGPELVSPRRVAPPTPDPSAKFLKSTAFSMIQELEQELKRKQKLVHPQGEQRAVEESHGDLHDHVKKKTELTYETNNDKKEKEQEKEIERKQEKAEEEKDREASYVRKNYIEPKRNVHEQMRQKRSKTPDIKHSSTAAAAVKAAKVAASAAAASTATLHGQSKGKIETSSYMQPSLFNCNGDDSTIAQILKSVEPAVATQGHGTSLAGQTQVDQKNQQDTKVAVNRTMTNVFPGNVQCERESATEEIVRQSRRDQQLTWRRNLSAAAAAVMATDLVSDVEPKETRDARARRIGPTPPGAIAALEDLFAASSRLDQYLDKAVSHFPASNTVSNTARARTPVKNETTEIKYAAQPSSSNGLSPTPSPPQVLPTNLNVHVHINTIPSNDEDRPNHNEKRKMENVPKVVPTAMKQKISTTHHILERDDNESDSRLFDTESTQINDNQHNDKNEGHSTTEQARRLALELLQGRSHTGSHPLNDPSMDMFFDDEDVHVREPCPHSKEKETTTSNTAIVHQRPQHDGTEVHENDGNDTDKTAATVLLELEAEVRRSHERLRQLMVIN